MRPTGDVLRREEYSVETIPLDMGRALVALEHYAGGSSNTAVYRHGLFRTDDPMSCLGFAQWLPPTRPAALTLLTYADDSQGHTGAIYRATNWTYLGIVKGHPRWVDAQGRQVATKATKNRTYAQMLALGFLRLPAADKHKFVKHLSGSPARTSISKGSSDE